MANIADRLTIQIDLSGFSFKITKPSGEIVIPKDKTVSSGGLSAMTTIPQLAYNYSRTDVIVDTYKYTLVPTTFFSKEESEAILSEIHSMEKGDKVMSIELPQHEATMVFAIPEQIYATVSKIQREAIYTPIVYHMINTLPQIEENNKVCVHFSDETVHIVAAERNQLLLANSYPAKDFVTAQYYIFLVIKEAMFNLQFTTIQLFGDITKGEKKGLTKYFKGVNIHTL